MERYGEPGRLFENAIPEIEGEGIDDRRQQKSRRQHPRRLLRHSDMPGQGIEPEPERQRSGKIRSLSSPTLTLRLAVNGQPIETQRPATA